MSYCIYLRKSRADAELERLGQGETLSRHRRTLSELAERQGYEIGKVYEEIVSGETLAARPQMQQLLSDVEQGLWQGVLVMELERLARGNSIDQGIVIQAFQITGTLIITPVKVYDPNTEFDEEYLEFGLFMSRREYKTINRRLQAGRIASVKEGNYIASSAPYGYDKVRLDHGKGYTLTPNADAQYVRLIFEWYVYDRLTVHSIADKLTALGVTPAKGGIHFSPHTLRGILRNQVYIGKVTWNWRKRVKTISNGEVITHRPKSEDMLIFNGKHEAIVPEDLFRAAQERTGNNHRTRKQYDLVNPFAGLIHCRECGRAVVYKRYSKASDVLLCPNKYCDVSSVSYSKAESAILDSLRDELGALRIKCQNGDIPRTDSREKAVRKELSNIKQQMNKLYDLLEQGIYTPEIFAERQKVLTDKKQAAEQELQELREQQTPDKIAHTMRSVDALLREYDHLTAAQKNALLKQCVSHISYYREKSNRYDQKPLELDVVLKF